MSANLKCIVSFSIAFFAIVNTPQVAALSPDGSHTPPVVVPMLLYSCMAACYLKIENVAVQTTCFAACIFAANVGVKLFN